jgi:hypothetical protein
VIANTYAEAGDTAIPKRMRLFRVDDSETRTYFVREPEQIIRALNHLSARYDPLKFSVAPTSEDQQVLPALSHGLAFRLLRRDILSWRVIHAREVFRHDAS